jgi:predicted ABC-type ATPase
MTPTLCIIGGCNGAGKTTLARELLPRMGIMRFLNADEIARGLSPLDPTLTAFKAGRLLLEEAQALMKAGSSFAIESTLSGKTYVTMLRKAKAAGYRVVVHYIMIGSASHAVDRVALRVKLGGHHVPEDDVRRRFERSVDHFMTDYLPLADEWGLWDNHSPPAVQVARNTTHSISDIPQLLSAFKLMETAATQPDAMTDMVLEASRVATAKMLDYYKRMGIKVTPQMTLAPEPKKRVRKAKAQV